MAVVMAVMSIILMNYLKIIDKNVCAAVIILIWAVVYDVITIISRYNDLSEKWK